MLLARVSLAAVVLLVATACQRDAGAPRESTPVRVAAASDLSHAFPALGAEFERQSGQVVIFSFGSSGLLAKQLRQGAPFDVFAAANVSFVDEVVAAGVCDGRTRRPYARGRIAIWSRRRALQPPAALEELASKRFARIAIANPAHAPYGQAAREALRRAGSWSAVEARVVYGENVVQALQLASSGNAEVAVVALALVADDRENPWLLVDEHRHPAIDQTLVVCGGGGNRAGGEAFARFVGSQPGRELMRRHGFLLPGETLTAQR